MRVCVCVDVSVEEEEEEGEGEAEPKPFAVEGPLLLLDFLLLLPFFLAA